jgi:8-oxo-dGTP diphosphatase
LSHPEKTSSEPAAVQVVAAVIHHPDGRFLLAQRPAGKVYAGYWEFPGGKIEPGESAPAALTRELHEELGIEVRQAYPWITRHYVYAHATVDLNFYRVTRFDGTPQGRENQAFTWQDIEHIDVAPMLPANGPILAALALPQIYGITNAAETGTAAALDRIERALDRGMKLIQVREPELAAAELREFAATVVLRAHARRARVVINSDADLARAVAADGVHLKASALRALSERPACSLVGASCHDAEELALAVRLGVDFAVLGPVAPTLSHPGVPSLGFDAFARIVRGCPIPVYALGGMKQEDMTQAWECGAHGIAMQRGAWTG